MNKRQAKRRARKWVSDLLGVGDLHCHCVCYNDDETDRTDKDTQRMAEAFSELAEEMES